MKKEPGNKDGECADVNHAEAGLVEIEKQRIPNYIQNPLQAVHENQLLFIRADFPQKGQVNTEANHDAGPGKAEYPARWSPRCFGHINIPIGTHTRTGEIAADAQGQKIEEEEKQEAGNHDYLG